MSLPARNDRRLNELLDLLARKNASPSDAALETRFYNDMLTYLLTSSSSHWWCTEAEKTIAQESLWLFSLPDHESIQKYKQRLAEQLSSCNSCVAQYHRSKPFLRERYLKLFSVEDVDIFFNTLNNFDKERVLSILRQNSVSRQDNPTQPFILEDKFTCAVIDVAYSPGLLQADDCDLLFCELFDCIHKGGLFPALNAGPPSGLILLAFHHHRIVRLWARKLLEQSATENHVISEVKENLQHIMEWMTTEEDHVSTYPAKLAKNLADRWKALGAAMKALSQDKARSLINIPFSRFLQQRIAEPTAPIPEIIKSLPDLTRKLGEDFWDKEKDPNKDFEDLITQICEHTSFQETVAIAQAENAGKIMLPDGTVFPEEKLVVRFKSCIDWIYHLWLSLPTSNKKQLTDKVYRLLFGYFQLDDWSDSFKACCAELGAQVVRDSIEDGNIDDDINMVDHTTVLAGYAASSTEEKPQSLKDGPLKAAKTISMLLQRESARIRECITAQCKGESHQAPRITMWQGLSTLYSRANYIDLRMTLLVIRLYSGVATVDFTLDEDAAPDLQDTFKKVQMIHGIVAGSLKILTELRYARWQQYLDDLDAMSSLLKLICHPLDNLRNAALKALTARQVAKPTISRAFQQLYSASPTKFLTAFNSLLDNYNDYAFQQSVLATMNIVTPLNEVLLPLMEALTGQSNYLEKMAATRNPARSEEQDSIKHFWRACWRTIDLVFAKARDWAETHKPSAVIACITPMFGIAANLANSRTLFQKAINAVSRTPSETACKLECDNMNTAVDSISQWIFVARSELLSKLMPVLTSMLHELQQVHLKISVETYELLMGTITDSSSTLMTQDDKEQLFMALSAHEPANNIYIQESSDEEIIEWQTVDTAPRLAPQTISPPEPEQSTSSLKPILRQSRLEHAFSRASEVSSQKKSPPKITSYFSSATDNLEPQQPDKHANESAGHQIEQESSNEVVSMDIDDDNVTGDGDEFDDFDDFDFSQIPDDWFEAKSSEPFEEDLSAALSSSSISTPSEKPSSSKLSSMADAIRQQRREQEARQQASKVSSSSHPSSSVPPKGIRFIPQATKPTAYAVTSTGRKLKPPSMGFSKLKALREEHRAERRLTAATKAPSAMASSSQKYRHQDDGSSSDSSSSDEEGGSSGLSELVKDMGYSKEAIEAEKASMKALFEAPKKRPIKLLEAPDAQARQAKKMKMQMREERRKRVTPDIQRLFKAILSWDVTSNTEVPPDTPTSIYTKVPDKFSSYQDYVDVFEPLLLLEVWMQLIRSREMLNENDIVDRCILHERCHVSDFVDLTFEIPTAVMNTLLQDDLICIANHFGSDFFRRTDIKMTTMRPGGYFLGKVQSTSQRQGTASVTVRSFFPRERITLLNSLSPKSSWRIVRMFSLTTAQREYAALQGMEHYELAKDILEPQPSRMPIITDKNKQRCIRKYGVNEPQAEAILGALDKKRGFTLIQGPPGTGKTKTILGLIVSLLDEQKQPTSGISIGPNTSNRGIKNKIMVCAPSNAAVDEIAKRLQDGIPTVYGVVKPNVVRVGTIESVNASVKDLLLDRLIEKELELTAQDKEASKSFAKRRDALAEEIRKLQLDIDDIERKLSECTDRNQMYSLRDRQKELINKRNKTKTMIKSVYDEQRDYSRDLEVSRLRARQQVFNKADVVCCTLSSSGHETLTSAGLTFETVIVDEAAQSVEISSLIPLKYDCKRCVLVGDPNQLPPTVLSLVAAKYSYEQSLFVRLQKNAPKDVYLLSIQYRMHPEISRFPSKLFYNARLLDGPDMADITSAPWHSLRAFPPYCFYNVEEGVEKSGAGQSFYNAAEAEAAVTLVDLLATQLPHVKLAYRIGVITPYKQQLSQLKSRFEKQYGPKILEVIDFNTVDGFQGQEKDIIIFSCVRAGSDRGIGFLSDIRRMNVGLTRAKCSLFILGHRQSLTRSEYWRELVEDARSRRLLVNIRAPYFDHRMISNKSPPNLFEKETPAKGQKYRLPSSKSTHAPMKIALPVAEDSADDRSMGKSNSDIDSGSTRHSDRTTLSKSSGSITSDTRKPSSVDTGKTVSPQPTSHRSPENNPPKQAAMSPPPPPARPQGPPLAPQKLTLSQFRASRGQPPINSSTVAAAASSSSSSSSYSYTAGSSGLLRRPQPSIYIPKKPKRDPAPRRPPLPPP